MRHEILKHKWAYGFLLVALATFGLGFFAVWPDRVYQRVFIIAFSIFYFFWGLVTHFKSKKLTQPVFMEYLAISLLIGVLLFLVTL
ncbi:MAG: hypothetical protein IT416_04090 [Candidatus Pacebacteria bacterium]|nr:hypothetical protein [Candidatus Paceibacterota bacterium]